MNLLKVSLAGLLLMAVQVKSQKTEQKKPDNPVKCTNIKEGKFLRANYPESIWHMTIKDNIQTEYFNNGKDYIKSTLVLLMTVTINQLLWKSQIKMILHRLEMFSIIK
jgi:hypothetical protein